MSNAAVTIGYTEYKDPVTEEKASLKVRWFARRRRVERSDKSLSVLDAKARLDRLGKYCTTGISGMNICQTSNSAKMS
jgi:hypothetical protein